VHYPGILGHVCVLRHTTLHNEYVIMVKVIYTLTAVKPKAKKSISHSRNAVNTLYKK